MAAILKVHPNDNVIVALEDLAIGTAVTDQEDMIRLVDAVPAKHKFTTTSLEVGDHIIMYGIIVGRATRPIAKGERITTQNVVHATAGFAERREAVTWQTPDVSKWHGRHFNGYHRSDGKVGTANYWLVIPLVFCENRNIYFIRQALEQELGYAKYSPYQKQAKQLVQMAKSGRSTADILALSAQDLDEDLRETRPFPHVDGIKFLSHQQGCGETRQDSQALCNLLAGYINNPNVAGATVLSLGCQNAQVSLLQEAIQQQSPDFDKPLYIFEQQRTRSENTLVSEAIKHTLVGVMEANELRRQPAPLSKLNIGLECGGSDGFSGLSANPAMGHCADLLVALGGTVMLAEFPELCGVEKELMNRAVDEETAVKFKTLLSKYAQRVEADGSSFAFNPSPGNIRDGLITDAMKSAGAAKKGGASPVAGVLDYSEQPTQPGLNLLCTPGGDVESTTALAGSGANLIMFSTGLGTPTGNVVAPTLKISTNSQLAQRMPDIIDYDAGGIITGELTIEQAGEALLELCLQTANGEFSPKAVQLGQDDFIPWKRGISL